ncbi:hypothetical protein CBOM_05404 [Ceraceosorus bombacis]|uniref:Uncharacterized protein n=1 Tax=Ceraceosorus bombacis TaxID=401625 RepID=A0A0P1BRU3_9BASI|nr:hypothetical protein CBOM_05404 [Ceraceosorus bombacis]
MTSQPHSSAALSSHILVLAARLRCPSSPGLAFCRVHAALVIERKVVFGYHGAKQAQPSMDGSILAPAALLLPCTWRRGWKPIAAPLCGILNSGTTGSSAQNSAAFP